MQDKDVKGITQMILGPCGTNVTLTLSQPAPPPSAKESDKERPVRPVTHPTAVPGLDDFENEGFGASADEEIEVLLALRERGSVRNLGM